MCGIFAYLNYLTPSSRRKIIEILINGLKRLEYRGYDSAGIAFDCKCDNGEMKASIIKKKGKVQALVDEIQEKRLSFALMDINNHEQLLPLIVDDNTYDIKVHSVTCGGAGDIDFETSFDTHVGIAHTRWATHGEPSIVNSHPQRSGEDNEFLVIHNGILTNYKDIRAFLERKGFVFESDTDTEVIPKLTKHIYDSHSSDNPLSFRELVENVVQQLEGAYALAFKSSHFPGECVVTRRGSPLLVGVKTSSKLSTDHIPIFYSKASIPSYSKKRSVNDEADPWYHGDL